MNLNNAITVRCEVYHDSRMPPLTPDVITNGRLIEIYERGQMFIATPRPSHLLVVPLTTDIRDGGEIGTAGDFIFIPDGTTGGIYSVVAVVRREGQRACYLRRVGRVAGAFTPY